jgi:DNA-binding response OmpR family regulator
MHSKRALLVDENPELKSKLAHVLHQEDWIIETAKDNQDALMQAKQRCFDLVITGAETSGREDLDLLREIRQTGMKPRMIIVTDEHKQEDVIESMKQKVFSYVSTPISADLLPFMVELASKTPSGLPGIHVLQSKPEWIGLRASCDLQTAERIVQFMRELKADLEEPEREAVSLAFREILLNAIEYGGKFDPQQFVEISYMRTERMVLCHITDPGEGFPSEEELPHAAVDSSSDDPLRLAQYREAQGIRAGGFGGLIARSLLDDLIYNEKGNAVVMVKYLVTRSSSV